MAGKIKNKPKRDEKISDRANFVETFKAGFKDPGKREDYLTDMVLKREAEERRKKKMQKGS